MTYTTSTTITSWYPVASGSTTVDPYYTYATSTFPATISVPSKKENKEYICNYCGTRYIDIQGGFIPNCKNCGAKLDKVEGE